MQEKLDSIKFLSQSKPASLDDYSVEDSGIEPKNVRL